MVALFGDVVERGAFAPAQPGIDGGSMRALRDRVDVDPDAVQSLETAVLVHPGGAAGHPAARYEVDRCVRLVDLGSAADLQAQPLQARWPWVQSAWARTRVPGIEQVVTQSEYERAVAGAHEAFRIRRLQPERPVMPAGTALFIGHIAPAGARRRGRRH